MVQGDDTGPHSAQGDTSDSGRPAPGSGTPVTLDASALFGGGEEVRLLHRGQEYRLRITRQGKLILTK
jgi:hemin uptake protein HemP